MNKRTVLWISFGLLALLLGACSLVGSKADVIKCTGTQNITAYLDRGTRESVGEHQHLVDAVIKHDQKSNCPELTGVFTAKINNYADYQGLGPMWGTFRLETAYNGGGVWEGTFHGYLKSDGSSKIDATSHMASGSLSGLQLNMITKLPDSTGPYEFEATIQNTPQE